MFSTIVFATVLAGAQLAHAIVGPNEPAPGDTFNQGTNCSFAWSADDSGTTAWKGMAVELMTGSNEQMVHLTTVAQGLDGSVAGSFSYACPDVTPNSPIYFYQFTSGGTPNVTWTGRFTIAGTDGSSTAALQTEQSAGTTVHWGTGALTDPSIAIAAPSFGSASAAASNSAAVPAASASVAASSVAPSVAPSTSPAASKAAAASPSLTRSVLAASAPASTSSAAPQSSGSSAALAMDPMAASTVAWPLAAGLATFAAAFTIIL